MADLQAYSAYRVDNNALETESAYFEFPLS